MNKSKRAAKAERKAARAERKTKNALGVVFKALSFNYPYGCPSVLEDVMVELGGERAYILYCEDSEKAFERYCK